MLVPKGDKLQISPQPPFYQVPLKLHWSFFRSSSLTITRYTMLPDHVLHPWTVAFITGIITISLCSFPLENVSSLRQEVCLAFSSQDINYDVLGLVQNRCLMNACWINEPRLLPFSHWMRRQKTMEEECCQRFICRNSNLTLLST